eukprot:TRINITY_DN7387_c0_g1_i1.p1 TRINITY_DN7387_c0_g1~~TRINITY_DN7387_c0_g1_i1.p1  ORF type:complete len:1151 (+),score=378.54 TRINITY_DN7387_c0_g1_i1:117-3569(+)
MPFIVNLPVQVSEADGIEVGDRQLRINRRHWQAQGGRRLSAGTELADAPDVGVSMVCRAPEETAVWTARDVAAKVEAGSDVALVLYGPAPGRSTEDLFAEVCEQLCNTLRRRMDDIAEAQEAASRVQQFQQEHRLSQAAALAKRRQSLGELEETPLKPQPPAEKAGPSAAAQGLKRRLSMRRRSLQQEGHPRRMSVGMDTSRSEEIPETGRTQSTASLGPPAMLRDAVFVSGRRGSEQSTPPTALRPSPGHPGKFRDAVRRASQVTDPGDAAAGLEMSHGAMLPMASGMTEAQGMRHGRPPAAAMAEDPIERLVRKASQRAGITDLEGKEGHYGQQASIHFDGKMAHLELRDLRGIGQEMDRLGVEFWIRTECGTKKSTVLQLLGNKMETLHILLNQDLDYEISAGLVYCRVKDQLFNELEVVADTGEVILDGRWHHCRWIIDDLQEDRTHFWLDGVPLRVRVGAHTCPYKFDGWGADGDEGECWGAIAADWKALRGEAHVKPSPFCGSIAEFTIWGGDRILHYWPLTKRSRSKTDVLLLQDMQGGTCAEVKHNACWIMTSWPRTSMLFDGTNYLNCGTMGGFGSQLADSVTIDLWFTTKNADRAMSLLHTTDSTAKQQTVQVAVNLDEKGEAEAGSIMLRVRDRDGREICTSLRTSVSACDGSWHHLQWGIFDVQTNSMRVDLDGQSVELKMGRMEAPSNFANFTEWICIGAHNNHGAGVDSFFDGSIKAVKVWEGRGRSRLLLAYLKLEEGPGATIALDSSGNGHNGVISRLPPSAQTVAGRRNSILGRRASACRLRNARDVSFRHAAWLPLPQPHVNDQDIQEERLRRRLLVKAHRMMQEGHETDINIRVAYIEVAAQEVETGVWGEAVVDLLHSGTTVNMLPSTLRTRRLSQVDGECLPPQCFEDITPSGLRMALVRGRAERDGHPRQGHQVIVLWLGDVRVVLVQLQMRPAQYKLTACHPGGKLDWTGPLRLAGAEAKKRHVLLRGLSACESLLAFHGVSTPSHMARAAGRAERGHLASLGAASAVCRALEHTLMRKDLPPAELLLCLTAMDREQILTTMTLCDHFQHGARRLAAILIQKVWRGCLARLHYYELEMERDRQDIRRRAAQKQLLADAMGANSAHMIRKVAYQRWMHFRNLAVVGAI